MTRLAVLIGGVLWVWAPTAMAQDCDTNCTTRAGDPFSVVTTIDERDAGTYAIVRNGVADVVPAVVLNGEIAFLYQGGLSAGAYTFTITDAGHDVTEPNTLTVTSAQSTQAPFYGTPAALPGVVQAEDYDVGGEGIAYHDAEPSNLGVSYRADGVDIKAIVSGSGYQVGWTATGDWMEYSVDVAAAGAYTVSWRVASGNAGGGVFRLEIDGVNVTGSVLVPFTNSYDTFAVVEQTLLLSSGPQIWRVVVEQEWFDMDAVTVAALVVPDPDPAPPPSPDPPPTPTDPCTEDPLRFAVNRWPSGSSGNRRLDYRSDRAIRIDLNMLSAPWTATAVDSRGCFVTVSR